MSDKTPIVFIHYGDTPYLRYTLDIAKKLNPEKKVFLLGDKKNKKYKKYNVRHNYFSKYNKNESIKKLNKNFIYIGGTNRQTDQDKRFELFCFRRWFYLYEFMKKNRLNKCWYFDSDTLILSDLSKEEEKFENYDITEQSNGSNMKGLIKIDFLENFINTINKIFLDKNYLENQKKDIKNNPNYAFCDMRAYSKFKEASKPKSIMLKTILNNKNYDENICQKDGMETEFTEELKREVKKLYFKNGKIFEKNESNGKMVEIVTLNLSWVTTSFIEKIYYYKLYGKFPPFYISLLGKISRIPRFIKIKRTKNVK